MERHIYYGFQKRPRPACIEPWLGHRRRCAEHPEVQSWGRPPDNGCLDTPHQDHLGGFGEAKKRPFEGMSGGFSKSLTILEKACGVALRAFSRPPRPPSKKLKENIPEDRSKGLSNSCQPSFCSSLGSSKAGQGLLAF